MPGFKFVSKMPRIKPWFRSVWITYFKVAQR